MTDREFFKMTALQYMIQDLTRKIKAFESDEKYIKMKVQHIKEIRALESEIKKLKRDLSKAHIEIVSVRKNWSEIFDDLEKEHKQEIEQKDREIEKLKNKNLEMARQRDAALDKLRDSKKSEYQAKSELEEAKEKIKELNIRINKDYTNSSKPSSQSPNHKAIPNGRVKSGKKPGGQKGHDHHPRKAPENVTETVYIDATEEMINNPDLRPTRKEIVKYLIRCRLVIEVTKYVTPVYRNRKNGSRVHAPFPANLKDEINYDGTVKACAFLLKDTCNVSVGKTQNYLREISGGKLNLSAGMISNLTKEFSDKTEKERNDIYLDLYTSPVMHADFTFGRVNGITGTVLICANENGAVLYQSKEKKGDEGVKGSPLEFYEGTTISDHESALIKHGSRHQECMVHVRRYLISSIENEKKLTWNHKMKEWVDESIPYRNRVTDGLEEENSEKDTELLNRYDEIIKLAEKEYNYEPPEDSFRDGYNLFRRMKEDKDDYVLFLINKSISPNNNIAERYARVYKRKNIQAMCFRSKEGVKSFCNSLSIIETLKNNDENLFIAVTDRFNKTAEV